MSFPWIISNFYQYTKLVYYIRVMNKILSLTACFITKEYVVTNAVLLLHQFLFIKRF